MEDVYMPSEGPHDGLLRKKIADAREDALIADSVLLNADGRVSDRDYAAGNLRIAAAELNAVADILEK